jgi:hypothetical protein
MQAASFFKDPVDLFFNRKILFNRRGMVWFTTGINNQWAMAAPMLVFSESIYAINIM